MKYPARFPIGIAIGAVLVLLAARVFDRPPSDLEQAANAVQALLAPRNLSRSVFSVAFPRGTPSQYVSFLFSGMGTAEGPPRVGELSEVERQQLHAGMAPVLPDGVALVPRQAAPDKGRQIVIASNDTRGVIIVFAYSDPATEQPDFVREWPLRHVEPAPGIEVLYREYLDQGLSAQSF